MSLESQIGRICDAHHAVGAQIAAVTYGGGSEVDLAVGHDLLGVPLTARSVSHLYCLAKPVLGASAASDSPAWKALSQPIGDHIEVTSAELAQMPGTRLLDNSACLSPMPTAAIGLLPRRLARAAARQASCRPELARSGHARYQDLVPWLLADDLVEAAVGRGLLDIAHERFHASGLHFEGPGGHHPAGVQPLVDGVAGPRSSIPFTALHHPSLRSDRSPQLGVMGSAVALARAMAEIGLSVELGDAGTECLVPWADAPIDFTCGQRYGVGTTLGLEAYGVGRVGEGLVGHLGWAGAGASWFDQRNRLGVCIRFLGLEIGAGVISMMRLRAAMAVLARELDV